MTTPLRAALRPAIDRGMRAADMTTLSVDLDRPRPDRRLRGQATPLRRDLPAMAKLLVVFLALAALCAATDARSAPQVNHAGATGHCAARGRPARGVHEKIDARSHPPLAAPALHMSPTPSLLLATQRRLKTVGGAWLIKRPGLGAGVRGHARCGARLPAQAAGLPRSSSLSGGASRCPQPPPAAVLLLQRAVAAPVLRGVRQLRRDGGLARPKLLNSRSNWPPRRGVARKRRSLGALAAAQRAPDPPTRRALRAEPAGGIMAPLPCARRSPAAPPPPPSQAPAPLPAPFPAPHPAPQPWTRQARS